jgi:hypothetical protein
MDLLFLLLPATLVAAEYYVVKKSRKPVVAPPQPCADCF